MNYNLNDIVEMKKQHPCKKSNQWKIIRMGADIRIKCLGCGSSILFPRAEFEKKLKKVNKLSLDLTTEEGKAIFNILKTTQIGDVIVLKDSVRCKNHEFSYNKEEWEILKIKPRFLLKCKECNAQIELEHYEYLNMLSSNRSLNKRNKKRNKEEEKILFEKEKNLIEKDHNWQIKRFGKTLKNQDIVILNDEHRCPNCSKAFYQICSIPKLVSKPVLLKCASCNDLQKNKYTESLQPIEATNDFNYFDIYKNSLLKSNNKLEQKIITCPNCGNNKAILKQKSFYPAEYSISCETCLSSKSFSLKRLDFFDSIIETNEMKILEQRNQTFKHYKVSSDRLSKNSKLFSNISEAINKGNITLKLQLIDSPHNHVTALHTIENKEIYIAYKVQDEKNIRNFSYKCHYCADCNIYFDFYSSFISQLGLHKIDINSLCIKLFKSKDDTDFGFDFEVFNSESLLHSMGYKVGITGLSKKDRQDLLNRLLQQKILTIGEMKSTINNDIHRFSNRIEYNSAVNDWKQDIIYLNSLIKSDI